MSGLEVTTDPGAVGFDAARLERIPARLGRYVDDGRLAGWLCVVARHGEVAHVSTRGVRDLASGAPVETDTVWRLFSMTKPITSVAALMLYEEGAFGLKDPIAQWLPEWADVRVWRGGSAVAPVTEPATEPIRVWHLLTHTAGLTYGFHHTHPVDAIYRAAGFEWGSPPGLDLAGASEVWASLPLVFQPGSEWNYGISTDVLGRLLEAVTGAPLDEVLRTRVLEPLGMADTAFWADERLAGRLASLYVRGGDGRAVETPMGALALSPPDLLMGGGGLVGTAGDYLRFAELLRRGGELDGVRLLGSRTVAYMTGNHLPGGADLEAFGRPLFAETTFDGVGFGLGVSVDLDPAASRVLGGAGTYGWGGAASTVFWVDPANDVTVVFMTQLLPSSSYPLRPQLKALVTQALVD